MALRIEEAALVGPADFEAFYAAYAPRVRGLIRRKVRNAHRVEDLVQETFMRAHRNAASFDTSQPVWPWLAAIASNLVIDSARRRVNSLEQPTEVKYLDRADTGADLADHYQRVERRHAISDVLRKLPERQRRVLVLRDVDGLRYDDLAEREGVTVDTVKALLKRARGGFREAYATLADERGLWAIGLLPLHYLRRGLHRAQDATARYGQMLTALTEGVMAPAAAVVASAAIGGLAVGSGLVGGGAGAPVSAAAISTAATREAAAIVTRAAALGSGSPTTAGATRMKYEVAVGPFGLPPGPSNTPPEAGAANQITVDDDYLVRRDHIVVTLYGIPVLERKGSDAIDCKFSPAHAAVCKAGALVPPIATDLNVGDPQDLPDAPLPAR